MADVDLVPAEYARSRLVRRRVRQLLFACIALAVAVGGARLALNLAMSRERQDIARLETAGRVLTQSTGEAGKIRQQKLFAEKQLAELDELRGRDRLRLLLLAIDAAYSDGIWLDELRFLRREHAAAGKTGSLPGGIVVVPAQSAAASGTAAPAEGTGQRVELIGHAANHTRLAEFMRGLSSQPGIADVRLLNTGLGSAGSSPAIDLSLMLLVDDKLRKPR